MSVEIRKAVVSRWNDAGLDESLGTLWYASGAFSQSTAEILADSEQSQNVFGTPPGNVLPRYEYITDFDDEENLWGIAAVRVHMVRFHAFRKTALDAMNDVDTIKKAFENSENAGTPFSIPSSVGNIMGLQHATRNTLKVADDIFWGIEQISIRWAECIVDPA